MAEQSRGGHHRDRSDDHDDDEDYEVADVELVYAQGDWGAWDDLLEWIDQIGPREARLSPARLRRMREDLERMKEEDVPFTVSPAEAFRLARAEPAAGSEGG